MTLLLCSMFPIGLLWGIGYTYGMLTVNIIIMMMVKTIFFKWYDSYKKRKAEKSSIKEELLTIAWHPSRYWDWCMSEEEKKETEKLWK